MKSEKRRGNDDINGAIVSCRELMVCIGRGMRKSERGDEEYERHVESEQRKACC